MVFVLHSATVALRDFLDLLDVDLSGEFHNFPHELNVGLFVFPVFGEFASELVDDAVVDFAVFFEETLAEALVGLALDGVEVFLGHVVLVHVEEDIGEYFGEIFDILPNEDEGLEHLVFVGVDELLDLLVVHAATGLGHLLVGVVSEAVDYQQVGTLVQFLVG